MKNVGIRLALGGLLLAVTCLTARGECPQEAVSDFSGVWNGVAKLLDANGEVKSLDRNVATYTFESCEKFSLAIQYFDPKSGAPTRTQSFTAAWDESANHWLLHGPIMSGILRHIDGGTYLASFTTKINVNVPGAPQPVTLDAFCDELINRVTNDGKSEITRAIECFRGHKGGPALAFRLSHEIKKTAP